MNFYFDESGEFNLENAGVSSSGIVVGVTIPEIFEADVFREYDAFLATLSPTAFSWNATDLGGPSVSC